MLPILDDIGTLLRRELEGLQREIALFPDDHGVDGDCTNRVSAIACESLPDRQPPTTYATRLDPTRRCQALRRKPRTPLDAREGADAVCSRFGLCAGGYNLAHSRRQYRHFADLTSSSCSGGVWPRIWPTNATASIAGNFATPITFRARIASITSDPRTSCRSIAAPISLEGCEPVTASEHLVQVHPDVVDTELDGAETVLLHLQSKVYFSLNATGTHIWQELKRGSSLAEISRQLQKTFDVDAARADTSVLALIDDLERQGLVVRAPASGSAGD